MTPATTEALRPTPSEIRAAKANQERCADLVLSCAYCGDHSALDRVTHTICPDCEAVMDRAAGQDADDRDLVLIAVSAYGAARYEAAVRACAETYDRMDRAHRRVIRLLDRALEPKRPRTSDGCRHPWRGAEDAGASSDEAHEHPGEGPDRPSAHTKKWKTA